MKKPTSINEIQVKHYLAWLRKAIKTNGKHAIVGNATMCSVDSFLAEMGFTGYTFSSGGELTTPSSEVVVTHWQTIGYYVYNDNHDLVIDAGEALEYALFENKETFLVTIEEEHTPEGEAVSAPQGKEEATMTQKHTFLVQLISTKGDVVEEYRGSEAVEALACYTSCFRQFLTRPNMEHIVTRIDGKNISKNFELILEDCYI